MKHNLLFLLTDEQRFDTMAAYGNGRIQMPNLDRLASKSCVFDFILSNQSEMRHLDLGNVDLAKPEKRFGHYA